MKPPFRWTMALEASPRIVIENRCASTIAERTIRKFAPYLERTAANIAEEYPAAIDDMVQEALIVLATLDLGRFTQRDAAYLRRILWHRMIDVYQIELRDGLTTGWSKHSS